MTRSAPLRQGLRIIFKKPDLILGEIAWRWTFGISCLALLVFGVRQYLSSLPISALDSLSWKTGVTPLMAAALAHIMQGTTFRLVGMAAVLLPALTAIWIISATLGRAATLKAMLPEFPSALRKLAGLAFLRSALLIAAALSLTGVFILFGPSVHRGTVLLPTVRYSFWGLAILCALIVEVWEGLNLLLSAAVVPATLEKGSAFRAIGSVIARFEEDAGYFAWVWLVIGAIRVAVAVVFMAIGVFVLAAVSADGGFPWTVLLALALGYFVVADFLKIWRLAAFVILLTEGPEGWSAVTGGPRRFLRAGVEPGVVAQVH